MCVRIAGFMTDLTTYLCCYRPQMEVAKRGADDEAVMVKPCYLRHRAIHNVEELWNLEEAASRACCTDLRLLAACGLLLDVLPARQIATLYAPPYAHMRPSGDMVIARIFCPILLMRPVHL